MGYLTRLLERRAASYEDVNVPLSGASILAAWQGPTPATGRRVNEEGALKLGVVYSCVRLIAESVAMLPLQVYRRVDRGREIVREHSLYRLLHDAPNPWMTAMQLRETLLAHCLLWGNAFAEVERDENGAVVALWPLRPDRMDRPKRAASGQLIYRYRPPKDEAVELSQLQVFHLRGLSSDGIWGYSPITLQREAVSLGLTAEEFAARFFGHSARPGGVLQVKSKLSLDAANKLRTQIEALHGGLENSHRLAVLEEGIEWKQVGMPLQDAQFLELRQYQRSEIAGWYRVPPHMIGDVTRSTSWGSGIEAQGIGFVVYTLQPWLERWEQEIGLSLLTLQESRTFYVEHNVDGLLRGDSAARQAYYTALLDRGVFSVNEVREKENLNPVEGGDQRFIQANMMPLVSAPGAGPGELPAGQPQAAPEANPSSGLDSLEIGRLLLNIQRLEELGEIEAAQKLRDVLIALVDGGQAAAVMPADREERSLSARRRLRDVFRPLWRDVAERTVGAEIAAIREHGLPLLRSRSVTDREHIGQRWETDALLRARSATDFMDWLVEYYRDTLVPLIERTAAPVLTAYSAAVERQVLDELGLPVLIIAGDEFRSAYLRALGEGQAGRSRGQVWALIALAAEQHTDAADLIEARLREWTEKRPGKIAAAETVRAGEALARNAYQRGGVKRVTWRAAGKNCPYCSRLNGRTVRIEEAFLPADQDYQPEGVEKPLRPRRNISHPPAHGSCDCVIRPVR